MATKYRKIRKKRGSRTCGGGSHKKSRKAGSRGGTGMAGTHKGKWTWVIKYDPEHFGDYGFALPKAVKVERTAINVGELDELAEQLLARGEAQKENEKIVVDLAKLNRDKVIGKGKVTKALIVKAASFSGRAAKKIEEAGGKAVVLPEAAETAS